MRDRSETGAGARGGLPAPGPSLALWALIPSLGALGSWDPNYGALSERSGAVSSFPVNPTAAPVAAAAPTPAMTAMLAA